MVGALAAGRFLRRRDGGRVALIRRRRFACPKISLEPGICGKKDTAGMPQRGTGI
jgi:hypothetical protein